MINLVAKKSNILYNVDSRNRKKIFHLSIFIYDEWLAKAKDFKFKYSIIRKGLEAKSLFRPF